jgi:flavin-binding protein dodecin
VVRANKTLKNVKGVWIKDQEVLFDKGKTAGYEVTGRVTCVLTD